LSNASLDKLKNELPEDIRHNFFIFVCNIDFLPNGEIEFNQNLKPTDFKDMKKVLNLNFTDLVKKRKELYDNEILTQIESIRTIEETELREYLIQEAIKVAENQKGEFYFMKIHFLKELLYL